MHDFWDFEAYRAFKEAIRQDSTAVMPYWGLSQAAGPGEGSVYKSVKQLYCPTLSHIVHMLGHIYNRVGDYKKAHDSFKVYWRLQKWKWRLGIGTKP